MSAFEPSSAPDRSIRRRSDLRIEIKARLRSARDSAGGAAAVEGLLVLHWDIGDLITLHLRDGMSSNALQPLAIDLQQAFAGHNGLTAQNLKAMRTFAQVWSRSAIQKPPLSQLAWAHHLTLLHKLKEADDRYWYAAQACENGWTRNRLAAEIDSTLYSREQRRLTAQTTAMFSPASGGNRVAYKKD